MKEVKVIITIHVHDPICQHSIAKEIENVVKDNIEKSYAKIISVEQETIKL